MIFSPNEGQRRGIRMQEFVNVERPKDVSLPGPKKRLKQKKEALAAKQFFFCNVLILTSFVKEKPQIASLFAGPFPPATFFAALAT